MSIFVGEREREHDEEGTFKFREPTQDDALKIPKIFNTDISTLQEQADSDESVVDLEGSIDDLNFDLMHDLLADLIVEWPEDAEITVENIKKLRIDILSWCMEQAFDVINDAQVSEDEEKN